ncbi:glycoside hydrolase family protein [Streptoalloteichus hindustanus]|uniref:hypothetical protein n=1 Tax=Streptoalloteichus hindustanus TaxID=2017 RepID=UPI0011612C5B|nr:hypothetical protein [Streptoalloteichus hindustanus]
MALTAALALSGAAAPAARSALPEGDWKPVGGAQRVYSPGGPEQYSYAPSAITDSGHTYYFTCHNATSAVIRDHVFFSQVDSAGATPQRDHFVLAPGAQGSWDATHICDPTVVAADVRYRQNTYHYVMFYLGTDRDNTRNRIGLAVANDLAGPWVKYPEPIVDTPFDDERAWGVGQPSATTIDPRRGEVLLFYSQGGPSETSAWRRHLKLSDLDRPTVGPAVRVSNEGIRGFDGTPDVLHNFDIAYDPPLDRFYTIREQGPYPPDAPNYISSQLEIVSIDGASIWNGGGTWKVEGRITPASTGFPRNHNPGILRNIYGMLPESGLLTAVFTKSRAGDFPDSLWSYDLWQVTGTLQQRD